MRIESIITLLTYITKRRLVTQNKFVYRCSKCLLYFNSFILNKKHHGWLETIVKMTNNNVLFYELFPTPLIKPLLKFIEIKILLKVNPLCPGQQSTDDPDMSRMKKSNTGSLEIWETAKMYLNIRLTAFIYLNECYREIWRQQLLVPFH